MADWDRTLDAHAEAIRYWQSDWFRNKLAVAWQDEPSGTPATVETVMAIAPSVLPECEPVWVSAEMCQLARYAAESWQPEPFHPQDLFTPKGFMVLEEPLHYDRKASPYDKHQDPLLLRLSYVWWLWEPELRLPNEGPGHENGFGVAIMSGSDVSGITPAGLTPSFRWIPQVVVSLDPSAAPKADLNAEQEGNALLPPNFFYALLRLSQQPLATHVESVAGRAARKRAERSNRPSTVTTIKLRRPPHKPNEEHEPGEAHYSHRFMVNGHWRNQWYPSIAAHRQIWVSGYVKGPEGAPLILKHRRFDLSR